MDKKREETLFFNPTNLALLNNKIEELEKRIARIARKAGVCVEYEWPAKHSDKKHKIRLCRCGDFYGIYYVDYFDSGKEWLVKLRETSIRRRMAFSEIAESFTAKVINAVKATPVLLNQSVEKIDKALDFLDAEIKRGE